MIFYWQFIDLNFNPETLIDDFDLMKKLRFKTGQDSAVKIPMHKFQSPSNYST